MQTHTKALVALSCGQVPVVLTPGCAESVGASWLALLFGLRVCVTRAYAQATCSFLYREPCKASAIHASGCVGLLRLYREPGWVGREGTALQMRHGIQQVASGPCTRCTPRSLSTIPHHVRFYCQSSQLEWHVHCHNEKQIKLDHAVPCLTLCHLMSSICNVIPCKAFCISFRASVPVP